MSTCGLTKETAASATRERWPPDKEEAMLCIEFNYEKEEIEEVKIEYIENLLF